MSDVRPFAGLRPPPDLASRLAAPPYDVVNTREARSLAEGNPQSFFHVSRPEIELPDSQDPHAESVYQLGRRNLDAFVRDGWLVPDPSPRYYVYRQRMGSHVQAGFVACASVAEYDRGTIKKHELTRADKEDDRTRHIEVMGANDEPVFLTYRADAGLTDLQERVMSSPPVYDFTSADGVGHTFWVVADPGMVESTQRSFAGVKALYVADGHHRSAAASRVARLGTASAHDERGYFLVVLFPHDQLQILDYNRVVKDLGGLSAEVFLEGVRQRFEVSTGGGKPGRLHTFGMLLGGAWYTLTAKPGSFDDRSPIGSLDVSVLQENLLGPVLGIKDPRKDDRIAFVGGIRGMPELEKLVSSGEFAVAFAMFPTTLDQLMAIADAGEIMPPKSTWFEPKLRSGLVVHRFQVAG